MNALNLAHQRVTNVVSLERCWLVIKHINIQVPSSYCDGIKNARLVRGAGKQKSAPQDQRSLINSKPPKQVGLKEFGIAADTDELASTNPAWIVFTLRGSTMGVPNSDPHFLCRREVIANGADQTLNPFGEVGPMSIVFTRRFEAQGLSCQRSTPCPVNIGHPPN